jgi:phosphoserine aminotransferase
MKTEELVKAFYTEKQDFLKEYLSENPESEVGQLIKPLNLTDEQNVIMGKIMNTTLTDVFYTILLGLDGCASIGGIQEMYELKDENGNQLSGEIEGYAYEYFHESN